MRHAKLAPDLGGVNDAPRGCVLEAVEKSWLADDLLGECGGRRQQDQHAQDSSNRHSRESGSTLQQRQLVNPVTCAAGTAKARRSEEHTSELQSLMRISYAVFCLKKKKT